MGRYNDMLGATRKALAARPGNPQALYLQAVLAARAQNYDLARSLMQRTGGAIDDLPGVLLLGGTLDYQAGAYEQAIEKWRELVGRQPMNVDRAAAARRGAAALGRCQGRARRAAPGGAARRRRQLHAGAGRARVRGERRARLGGEISRPLGVAGDRRRDAVRQRRRPRRAGAAPPTTIPATRWRWWA